MTSLKGQRNHTKEIKWKRRASGKKSAIPFMGVSVGRTRGSGGWTGGWFDGWPPPPSFCASVFMSFMVAEFHSSAFDKRKCVLCPQLPPVTSTLTTPPSPSHYLPLASAVAEDRPVGPSNRRRTTNSGAVERPLCHSSDHQNLPEYSAIIIFFLSPPPPTTSPLPHQQQQQQKQRAAH